MRCDLNRRDRVFYYGSHVIHATAMQIFLNYEKVLRGMNDLEEIVVFLNGRFVIGFWSFREARRGDPKRLPRAGEAGNLAVSHPDHARWHAGRVEVRIGGASEE